MKRIALTKCKFAIVDDEDFDNLSRRRWYYNGIYAIGSKKVNGKWKTIYMHREIVGAKNVEIVDHANRNQLDNRKNNLRKCNSVQNTVNSSIRTNNKSGYKGVHWFRRDSKWVSQIKVGGRGIHLGYFDEKEDAAKAYNVAAIKHYGEFANLNVC